MVMVVADPRFVSGDRTGRLDTPNNAGRGQCGQYVVDRLPGDLGVGQSDGAQDGVGVRVRVGVNRLQDGHSGTGNAQIGGPQLGSRIGKTRHKPHPSPFLDRVKIAPAVRWVWS